MFKNTQSEMSKAVRLLVGHSNNVCMLVATYYMWNSRMLNVNLVSVSFGVGTRGQDFFGVMV